MKSYWFEVFVFIALVIVVMLLFNLITDYPTDK